MRHVSTTALALLCLLAAMQSAWGVERFPRPQFETSYTNPVTTVPPAARASGLRPAVDIVVLAVALALAAHLALRARSRRGLLLLTMASILYFGFWRRGCVCSVGSVQNMVLALSDRGYAVPLVVVAFFLLPLVFTLFHGRTFCAAVCPLGGVQDLMVLKPVRLPAWLSHALGLVPYVVLGLAILLAVTGCGFLVCRYDPFVAIFRFSGHPGVLAFGAGLLVLGTVVARPYCRFLCPYGVLLSWLSRLARRHVTVTPDECILCRLCEQSCPFDAIRFPTAAAGGEHVRRGVRRLAILLALLPILMACGGWLGSRLEVPLSRLHPTIQLAELVRAQELGGAEASPETQTFAASGTAPQTLYDEALAARRRLAVGGWLFGGFVGLVVGAKLITLSVRRTFADYAPDRGNCLSCGRCFAWCPREHVRLEAKGEGRAAA